MLVIGALLFFFGSRRRKRQLANPGDVREIHPKVAGDVKRPLQYALMAVPAELDGTGVRRELP
jgi:hypothetical protein